MKNRKRKEFVGLFLDFEEKTKLQTMADQYFNGSISATLRWIIWHLTGEEISGSVHRWRKVHQIAALEAKRHAIEAELQYLTSMDT